MKLPNRKEMYRDNQKMVAQLKWCDRVIDELTIKNIELEMKLNDLHARDIHNLPIQRGRSEEEN